MIKRDNIEEKLFDYFEGALSSDEKAQVEQFVKENPEYQVDFDAWENSYLPKEEFVYDHVDDLIVKEGGDVKGLFARWKTGLIMLIVGAGIGGTLLNKMGSEDIVVETKSTVKQGKTEAKKEVASTVIETGEVKTDDLTAEMSADKKDKDLAESIGKTSDRKWAAQGEQNADVADASVANNVRHENTGEHQADRAKVANRGSRGSSSNTGSISNQGVGNNPTASASEMVDAMVARDYQKVMLEAERTEIEDLLSTPKLKQSRSKFQKYDINELKFINEKDPYFILPNGVALTRNPSHAGNGEGIRVGYNYNNQWPELSDNYTTQTVTVDGYSDLLKGGLGLVLVSDVLGHNKFTTRSASIIYAPKFLLFGKTTIEPSVQVGAMSKSVSWNQVKSDRLYDPRNGMLHVAVDGEIPSDEGSSSAVLPQLGFGLLLNTSKIFVGFSYDQILRPEYDFDGLAEAVYAPGQLNAQVGGSIVPVKDWETFVITPSINFYKVGGYDEVWLSNVVSISSLFVGASYSLDNEAMFGLGYNNKKIKVAYSYGRTNSPLTNIRSNSNVHQVGVTLALRKR